MNTAQHQAEAVDLLLEHLAASGRARLAGPGNRGRTTFVRV